MAEEGFKRKLAAILSADVEGYSRLMDDDEEATVRTLKTYRAAINDLVQQYRGRIVDSPGDNILAEFSSVVDAVNCAVEIQRDLAERNTELAYNRQMQFRIGVNLGDVIDEDGRIYGDGVNIAARVESLAEAGGICISGRAHTQVENKLGLEYEDLGKHEVKNISRPIQVYRVLSYPGAAAHRVVQAKETLGRRWRKIGFAAAVIVIVAVAIGTWQFYMRRPTVEPASVEKMAFPLPERPSIAVLPFDNMGGDPEQEYFCDGLSEEIITALSSVPELFVIARNSTFTYKGRPIKVQQISEELGVQYVLEGSVRKSGEKVRITAQLIDALKGHHLWAETYDRSFEDLFDLQEEISLKIITELRVKLAKKEDTRFAVPCSGNLKAYRKYMKALDHFYRFNRQDNVVAQRLTEEAIALDPGYACAYSLLGGIHRMAVELGISKSPMQSLATAKELVEKAIDLNPALPGPYAVLSWVYRSMGQYDKSIEEAEKAITLNPNSVLGNGAMGAILMYVGRSEESIAYFEKTIRFDPFSTVYFGFLGWSYFLSGRPEEAIQACKRAVDARPHDFGSQLCLASAYGAAGLEEEAQVARSKILRMNPKFSLDWFSQLVGRRYKRQADKDLIISSLRKAGLPDTPPLPLPDKPSIAVLAFDNLSGDPEQEYFSDGLSEEIINALSKTDQLFVIARNSSFTYKGKPVNVNQISRELGVRYVLEGSVRKSEDRVRITAQLIDATTGHHLWSERYDRSMNDIFAVQDEITKQIVMAMEIQLTEGDQARMWGKKYKNLDVYLKRMEALSLWREGSVESHMRHGQVALEIIDMAPDASDGYYTLGWNHWWLAVNGKSPQENLKKAYELAQKAISLDKSYALSHALLGSVYLQMRQYEKAIAAGKRSIELDPNGAQVNALLGQTLNYAGRPDEAIGYIKKGFRLNPFPPGWYFYELGNSYLQKGQYEKALTEYKKALQRAPKAAYNHSSLAITYILLNREEEAHASAAKALELAPYYSVGLFSKISVTKNKAFLKIVLDAMRKAGFPE